MSQTICYVRSLQIAEKLYPIVGLAPILLRDRSLQKTKERKNRVPNPTVQTNIPGKCSTEINNSTRNVNNTPREVMVRGNIGESSTDFISVGHSHRQLLEITTNKRATKIS